MMHYQAAVWIDHYAVLVVGPTPTKHEFAKYLQQLLPEFAT